MYKIQHFRDNFVEIMDNPHNVYEGNLQYYFGLVFRAPNIYRPYHDLEHMLSVTRICYRACRYYAGLGQMTRRQARNLLIAALFHDYGHPGFLQDDHINIETAVDALRQYILKEDAPHLAEIVMIIEATQYPHKDYGVDLTREQAVIRDADIGQTFGDYWIRDILFGLSKEMGKSPYEMLEMQEDFLRNIRFYSTFGAEYYGGEPAIEAKIKEVRKLLEPPK